MFMLSGYFKLTSLGPTSQGLLGKLPWLPQWAGLPLIVMAALLQLVAPALIVYDSYMKENGGDRLPFKLGSLSSLALAGFTVLATLVYHFPPLGRTYYPFISNVTTLGALLLLAHLLF